MKKVMLITPIAAALSLFLSGTSRAALVLHWALDETMGTVAADSSGNGIAGNWQGTVGSPTWVPAGGVSGGAFSFTGANLDSFITSTLTSVAGTPFSISLWVKSTSTGNNGLAYLGDGTTGTLYHTVRLTSGAAQATSRNPNEVRAIGAAGTNNGEWHHLVGVFTSDSERSIYVDGMLQATNTTNVPALPLNRFGIGALTRNTPYAPADLFTGQLDDVQVYSTPLNQSQISFMLSNPGVAVPEPTVAVLLALGLGVGSIRRRHQAGRIAFPITDFQGRDQ